MKGLVLKSTGSWYDVLGEDNTMYRCRLRGRIRLEEIKETNPVAVGDHVTVENESTESVISEILPRENYIVRQSVKRTNHSHVIAANVDQALLVVSLSFPRTSMGFIDRFLVSAESFRIPQVLAFNKKDLWKPKDLKIVNDLTNLYTSIGVTCLQTDATSENQNELQKIVEGKKTLFSGHSGVGKSTLLNKLSVLIQQKTGSVSDFTSKGVHTTTFAEMFRLSDDTFVIDTPGIKELGMVDMKPEEISDYFPEMRALRLNCKYGAGCLHIHEPHCAVKTAVEAGKIDQGRYESYISIVEAKDNRK